MKNFRLELAPLAEQDIADGFAWYEAYSRTSAEAWRNKIFEAISYVGRSPLAQTLKDDGNYRWWVRSTRHTLIYTVSGDLVTILAVSHHRRAPGYWEKLSSF